MSQRRSPRNVIAFPTQRNLSGSSPASSNEKLNSIRFVMQRASLRNSPEVAVKAARLHEISPKLSRMVEDLLDEVLEEVG